MIEEINKEKERHEKMLNVKIEDKRMRKLFDVSVMTPSTLDTLLRHIGL